MGLARTAMLRRTMLKAAGRSARQSYQEGDRLHRNGQVENRMFFFKLNDLDTENPTIVPRHLHWREKTISNQICKKTQLTYIVICRRAGRYLTNASHNHPKTPSDTFSVQLETDWPVGFQLYV